MFKKNNLYSLIFADDIFDMFINKSMKNGTNKKVESMINKIFNALTNLISIWRLKLAPQNVTTLSLLTKNNK